MTNAWLDALVPVKGFASAKERLSAVLSPSERVELARAMLTDVLQALQSTPEVARIWVISPDPAARRLAESFAAHALDEPAGRDGLNPALEAGRAAIAGSQPSPVGLLVLPMDVPGATAAALSEFAGGIGSGELVRLCPSVDGGTNALLLRPPSVIPFRFGRNSAARHREAARASGARYERHIIAALQTDVDRPADLARCLHAGSGPRTAALLERLALAERLRPPATRLR